MEACLSYVCHGFSEAAVNDEATLSFMDSANETEERKRACTARRLSGERLFAECPFSLCTTEDAGGAQ